MRGASGFGAKPARREVIDVPEPRRPDRRLDQLLHVRKQRLSRLERECNEARAQWRELRADLTRQKQAARQAKIRAHEEWLAARSAFFSMALTNGEFSRAKTVYEKMKIEADVLHIECRAYAARCRALGVEFFLARQHVTDATKQQEKLGVLRDEMKAALLAQNAEA